MIHHDVRVEQLVGVSNVIDGRPGAPMARAPGARSSPEHDFERRIEVSLADTPTNALVRSELRRYRVLNSLRFPSSTERARVSAGKLCGGAITLRGADAPSRMCRSASHHRRVGPFESCVTKAFVKRPLRAPCSGVSVKREAGPVWPRVR